MAAGAYNPSTEEDEGFDASLGRMVRPCLKSRRNIGEVPVLDRGCQGAWESVRY